MPLPPDKHHEDCDYRNSSAAVETDQMFGVPDGETANEVHDCNLGCTPPPLEDERAQGLLTGIHEAVTGILNDMNDVFTPSDIQAFLDGDEAEDIEDALANMDSEEYGRVRVFAEMYANIAHAFRDSEVSA